MKTIRWWPLSRPVSDAQPFTGERFTLDQSGEIRIEHLHRYFWASQLGHQGVWVDAACGTGYGTFMLANNRRQVRGFDIDAEAIDGAISIFQSNEALLTYEIASIYSLGLEDQSVDVMVSFETIEHVAEPRRAIREFSRCLNQNGLLAISSPNKATYSNHRPPHNSFHRFEYFLDELRQDLSDEFAHIVILGQWTLGSASVIAELRDEIPWQSQALWLNGELEGISLDSSFEPRYFIALASNQPIEVATEPSIAVDTFDVETSRRRIVHLEKEIFDYQDLVERERAKALSDIEAVKRDVSELQNVLEYERAKALADIEAAKRDVVDLVRLNKSLEEKCALISRELGRFVQSP